MRHKPREATSTNYVERKKDPFCFNRFSAIIYLNKEEEKIARTSLPWESLSFMT